MYRFVAYAYRKYDIFDVLCPPRYDFIACLRADSLKEARKIAGQLAPSDCTSFMILFVH